MPQFVDRGSPKTVLLAFHDRELLARSVDRIITIELGGAGNTSRPQRRSGA